MSKQLKLASFLPWVIKICLGLALFSPILMNSMFFFPFIVPKNLLFRVATEIAFAAYLLLMLVDKEYRLKPNRIVWAVLAYFSVTAVATFLGINIYTSLWGNYERMTGLIHNLHLLIYFIVLAGALRRKSDWYNILGFTIFISVLMSFIGFAQFLNLPFLLKSSGGSRLAATVGNAIYLAVYLMFHFFFIFFFIGRPDKFNLKMFAWCFLIFDGLLAVSNILYRFYAVSDWQMFNFLKTPLISESVKYPVYFWTFIGLQLLIAAVWYFRENKYAIRSLLGVILIFQAFIFWQTQTRGAILGLAAGIFVLLILSLFTSLPNKYKKISGGVLVLIILAPILLFALKDASFVKNDDTLRRLSTISYGDITTQSRVLTWEASWKGLSETPKTFLIGYGPENYSIVFNKYFPSAIFRDNGSQIWFDRAHNIVFDIAVTSGVIGLSAFLLILILACIVLFKNFRQTGSFSNGLVFIALIIAYFVQNLTVFDNLNTEVLLYLLLAYVAFLARPALAGQEDEADEENEADTENSSKTEINYIPVAVILLALVFGLAFNYKVFAANQNLISAMLQPGTTGSFSQAKVDHFISSINGSPVGQFEVRQQLSTYALQVSQDSNVPVNQVTKLAELATEELEKTIAQEPLNARYRLWLAMVYNSLSPYVKDATQKAMAHLEKAKELSPTRPQIYFEIGQSYAMLKQPEKAIESYKQGVALVPTAIDAHWNLETAYILLGNYSGADQELEAMKALGWQPGISDYQRLATLYDKAKNPEKVSWALREIIALDPTLNNYGQLAAYFASIGDNKNAEAVVADILKKFPEAKTQAETFLEKLRKGELKK